MAYPLFGTTATHAAALFANFGDKEAREYFQALKANDVMITDGKPVKTASPEKNIVQFETIPGKTYIVSYEP